MVGTGLMTEPGGLPKNAKQKKSTDGFFTGDQIDAPRFCLVLRFKLL